MEKQDETAEQKHVKHKRYPRELPEPIPEFEDFGHVPLESVRNVRDLGGMPTMDGHHIKPACLVRSAALHHISSKDAKLLLDVCQVRQIVDFRTDIERHEGPDPEAKLPGVYVHAFPVYEVSAFGVTREGNLAADMSQMVRFSGDPHEQICELYQDAVLSDAGRQAFSNFLRVLWENEEGSVLWHCSEGKDRTGLAALFIQHILGVSPEVSLRDYLATNIFAQTWYERMFDQLAEHHIAKTVDADLDALFYAYTDYLNSALAAIDKTYGSLDAYLVEGLGCSPDAQEALRKKYLE